MVLMSGRQAEVLEEFEEWREDVRERGIGSRVVLLAVPAGWGRSAVLARFRDLAGDADGPVTVVAGIDGNLPGGRAVQAAALREVLAGIAPPSRAAELLDLDTAAGKAALGLEAGAWFVPGLAVAVSVTMLSRLLGAAGRVRDDGPAGEAGAVARAARAVAAVSVKVPVVVVIDDADRLEAGLARAVISGLAGRYDGRVLVVAAASPDSALVTGLVKDAGYDLAGRVRKVSADPKMDYAARVELARELLPGLPAQAAERIARRTATFGEVFAVAAADMVAGLGPGTGAGEALAAADAVIGAVLQRAVPSREAAVLAWAGGTLHGRQADACLRVLGAEHLEGDVHVRRAGPLACLADPASPRCAEQAAAFSPRQRAGLAGAVLAATGEVAADSGAGLADRVVARQAVHRVRADLDPALRDQLPQIQRTLIRGLETLGDHEAAWQVAREALAETPTAGAGRQGLLMAYLRLARTRPAAGHGDPLAEEAIGLALAAGAAIGLEARVWAAADLLGRDGNREQALALAGQVTGELEARAGLGEAGDQWRLLLAFAAGRAGRPAITQRLLAPMLSSSTASREKPAQAVLRAVDGPHADIRLQIILLQAELEATPAAADDDQLRLHAALAAAYSDLGIYRQALGHGHHELPLRQRLQHPDHPDTLTTRANIAFWTYQCGDAAGALRLLTALLPDRERVLGPGHPSTLATRANIAALTGECGDAAGALRLFTALLPDQERVLGPGHPSTLTTRDNIASWAAQVRHGSGDEPDQPSLAELGRLADEAAAAGDTAAAVSYCEQMVARAEEAFGPGDIRLTGYLRRAASTLAAANRDAQAMETLTRAITINDRYGAETAEAVSDLRNLAGLQQRNGPHSEARQNLDRARVIEARHSRVAR